MIARKFEMRPRQEKARLYLDLGLDMAVTAEEGFSYAATVQKDQQDAECYLTLALSLDGGGPAAVVGHLVLGFLTASKAERTGSTEEIDAEFAAAEGLLAEIPNNDDLRSQYHYWKGRALMQIERDREAKQEFEVGLPGAKADRRGLGRRVGAAVQERQNGGR
jgi:hypothetical protein